MFSILSVNSNFVRKSNCYGTVPEVKDAEKAATGFCLGRTIDINIPSL